MNKRKGEKEKEMENRRKKETEKEEKKRRTGEWERDVRNVSIDRWMNYNDCKTRESVKEIKETMINMVIIFKQW